MFINESLLKLFGNSKMEIKDREHCSSALFLKFSVNVTESWEDLESINFKHCFAKN